MSPSFFCASVVANAAIGVAAGWAMGWLMHQMVLYNSLLWGSAIIPVIFVGLFLAVVTGIHPVMTAIVFPVTALTAAIITINLM